MNNNLTEKRKKVRRKAKRSVYDSISYTTGDIGLNINRFNIAMGTDCAATEGSSAGVAMGESLKLKENWEEFDFEAYNGDDMVTVVITDRRFDPLFKKNQKESLKLNNVTVEGQYLNGVVVTGKVNDIIQVCDECHVMNPSKIFMEALTLTEAKRYVRRYYIRPQNIFCSNKAEIIKALIELDDANCSVYTLNNLGDEKDVTKLMNSDIIYYYDDGILYDKNKVKVMDYDLSIKKEENRKHFSNVNKTSDKEFKAEYKDRMTDVTELEESLVMDALAESKYDIISADFTDNKDKIVINLNNNVEDIEAVADELSFYLAEAGISTADWATNGSNVIIFNVVDTDVENPFDLVFEDYTVFGEKLIESKESFCCVCGEPLEGYGNNPEPYMSADDGRCCDGCNMKFVIPMRVDVMRRSR